MIRVITIDPGDHTGTLRTLMQTNLRPNLIKHVGKTLVMPNMRTELWNMLEEFQPNVVVFERFTLRAASAVKQSGSIFLVCEMIGIVKLWSELHPEVELVELQPANKEYCGFSPNPKDPHYAEIQMENGEKITEHVRDTMRLFSYWKLFGSRFKNKKHTI